MNSILNRVKIALMPGSKYQRLGSWIMLLSSIAFFNIITWRTHFLLLVVPFYLCFTGTLIVFLIGALLAHGMQKTTYRFLQVLGINIYIFGWAFIVNGILVANTYLEMYFSGVMGVYVVFLGVVLYYMLKENPTKTIIKNHILIGLFLMFVGVIIFLLAYNETKITLLHLVRIGPLPAFWSHRGIVSVLVGNGLLLISLFMYFLHK